MPLTRLRSSDTVSAETFNALIDEIQSTLDEMNSALAGINKENIFEQKNTFKKDVVIQQNATVLGEIFSEGSFSSSDERLKKDFAEIKNGLEKILELKTYTYIKNGKREAGVKANDVLHLMKENVVEINGKLMVRYEGIIPYLVSAVHGLHKEIDKLKK